MKIRNILVFTFLTIVLGFALVTYVEHRYITIVADSFKNMERRNTPSLTALLELATATRRASIKAVEYSLRGKQKDRNKSREALQQMETELGVYRDLNERESRESVDDLTAKVAEFKRVIDEYLFVAEGPVIDEVLREQKRLHGKRSNLIKAVNQLLPENEAREDAFDLLLVKSEARKVSVKVIEFVLRGNKRDHDKALEAMEVLQAGLARYLSNNQSTADGLNKEVEEYLQTAHAFLKLTSARTHSVDEIYSKEQELHGVRKVLISALYPLIDHQYEMLNEVASSTSQQIRKAERIQILTFVVLVLFSMMIGFWLSRTISSPLRQLSHLMGRYGRGEKVTPEEIKIGGPLELAQLGSSVAEMVRERNSLDEELRQREAFVRMLFEGSPVGLALARMDGGLVEVNQAYAEIVGRSVQETLGLSYWDITPKDYDGDEQRQLDDLREKCAYGPYEKEYLHADGHRVPVRLLGRLVERDGEQFIWSAVENISASKQVEALNKRLAGIFENSFDEIYIFDDELKFIQVSSGALKNLGYSMDEMRAMGPADLKPDFDDEHFNAFVEPLRTEEKQQLVFETRHQRKDGSTYPVQVRLQASLVDNERIFSAIIVDITEQKKAEAEIERYQKHLEGLVAQRTKTVKQQAQIIDQTHDSVVGTDLDGIVTSWNGGAERMFGVSSDRAIGRPISFVYPEDQRDRFQTSVIGPLKEKGAHEVEVEMLHADGTTFPAHLSLSLLYDDQGNPYGMVGYSLDLSELKQREVELGRVNEQLEAANKELESFAYSVSHDLRAPLRGIDGFSMALMEDYGDQLDDTAQDYLQRVRNGAQRMGVLIDDMLQLSRVNRLELNRETIDMATIARSVVEELQDGEPQRMLELDLGDDLLVKADPRLLRVMLDNLFGNAWKFTTREEVSRISFSRVPNQNDTYMIRDNGVGFDMRHADKLFGAFQRLHRNVDFPGTGVGLATVQRIVHRHGGKVWAEAKVGEGASFYFTLDEGAGEAREN